VFKRPRAVQALAACATQAPPRAPAALSAAWRTACRGPLSPRWPCARTGPSQPLRTAVRRHSGHSDRRQRQVAAWWRRRRRGAPGAARHLAGRPARRRRGAPLRARRTARQRATLTQQARHSVRTRAGQHSAPGGRCERVGQPRRGLRRGLRGLAGCVAPCARRCVACGADARGHCPRRAAQGRACARRGLLSVAARAVASQAVHPGESCWRSSTPLQAHLQSAPISLV